VPKHTLRRAQRLPFILSLNLACQLVLRDMNMCMTCKSLTHGLCVLLPEDTVCLTTCLGHQEPLWIDLVLA